MISLCIIVRNNSETLKKCIESVKSINPEIIIVDTGSTDNSKEIALSLGAKIYDYAWNDNFSEAKNYALSKATSSWILNLDADETISKKDLEKIKEMIKSEEYLGYYLIQRNYTNKAGSFCWTSCKDDKYEESKGAYGFVPRKMVRLFKNDPRIKFEGIIHDSVIKSIENIGKIGDCDIPIHHYGLTNRSIERTKWYVEIEKKNLKNDFFQEYQIASQLHSIGDLNEAVNHLAKSIQLNPDFYLSLLELAIIGIKKGKIVESKPILLRSLELQEHEMTWSHLGIVEVYEKNYAKAINCFQKAISLNPKNADFYYNLGLVYLTKGDKEKAHIQLKKAAELNPYYADKINQS
ncbi:MAG: glycosyltransferase [Nanoarchaeota archaeon]